MKRFNIDWRYMRSTVIFVTVCLSICALLVGVTQSYYLVINKRHIAQRNVYNQFQQQYQAAIDDKRLLRENLVPYKRLVKQGLIGKEHRLYWVEALRNIAEELKLKKVTYRIEPQQSFLADYLTDIGEISVFASPMYIQMDLLHEGDLLYLIDELNSKAPGSFHVNSCKLKRVQNKFILHPSNTNMLAECKLDWFTLKAPGSQEG